MAPTAADSPTVPAQQEHAEIKSNPCTDPCCTQLIRKDWEALQWSASQLGFTR